MEICIICLNSNQITASNPLTDEHIVPEFLGGALTQKNVCKACNSLMGGGFEGRISKTFLVKAMRQQHSIKGKSNQLPIPFAGTYDNPTSGKFRVEPSGDIYKIPEINLTPLAQGVKVKLTVDASEKHSIKNLIVKALRRHYKKNGVSFSDEKLSKAIDDLLLSSDLSPQLIHSPEIQIAVELSLIDNILLCLKIGYELASYHFGHSYISDPVAKKIRLSLLGQNPDQSLTGSSHLQDDFLLDVFDDSHHWVLFIDKMCFVKTFYINAVFQYCAHNLNNSSSSGLVYKFCYKTRTHECIELSDFLLEQSERFFGSHGRK